jgi:hypothetical protein
MQQKLAILIAEAKNTLEIPEENICHFKKFQQEEFHKLGKNTFSAMIYSQIFIDFYTCIETFLFRVSQTFENNLENEKWHKSLLYKMSLDIPETRPAVISKETHDLLDELLRFRHFKRYYFSFNYDWDILELIKKKYLKVFPQLKNEVGLFISFLSKV